MPIEVVAFAGSCFSLCMTLNNFSTADNPSVTFGFSLVAAKVAAAAFLAFFEFCMVAIVGVCFVVVIIYMLFLTRSD